MALTRRRRRGRRGFTLLSMVVALVLLSVGIFALARANAASISLGTKSANRDVALAIGRSYVEVLRSRRPNTIVSESPTLVNENGVPDAAGVYTRSVAVTEVRDNLLQVQVAVDYPNPTIPVVIDTYVYRPAVPLGGP
jgi:type IV pilus assembly protein PilV